MLAMNAMVLFASFIIVDVRYLLYHSDNRQTSYPTFDCLYSHMIEDQKSDDKPNIRNYHLIPYCRRPDDDERQQEISTVIETITFNELRKIGVTSEQLLTWSASIDVAEKYEINNESLELFYNCSPPWFGSLCQYKFAYDSLLSFDDIVKETWTIRSKVPDNVTNNTCYRFLFNCYRGPWPLCLDWREICDGKIDCMSGEDEQWCETLEMTACADDQYRCHYGGQCIPRIFARDSAVSIDCLDGSDERRDKETWNILFNDLCGWKPLFRCEEHSSRYPTSLPCGNGQYQEGSAMPNHVFACLNKRDKNMALTMLTSFDHILDLNCRQAFRCSLLSNRSYGLDMVGDVAMSHVYFEGKWDKDCERLAKYCSPEWLVLPEKPVMFGFLQFIYLTNRSVDEFKNNVAPDFVCFDTKQCPSLLLNIVHIDIIDGLTCSNTSDLVQLGETEHFDHMYGYFGGIYRKCVTSDNELSCANSSFFHCNHSSKCIAYHRVGDGHMDCYFSEDELFPSCQLNDSNRFMCISDRTKCLLPVAINNGIDDCPDGEDERFENAYASKSVPFPSLCNRYETFFDPLINEKESDETNCEWWPCDNPYTHCDGRWQCLNGIDELNCPYTKCLFNEYQCNNEKLNLTYCLPLFHMFHKQIVNCTQAVYVDQIYFNNETSDLNKYFYSWNRSKCIIDDSICSKHTQPANRPEEVCLQSGGKVFVSASSDVFKLDKKNTYLCTIDDKVAVVKYHQFATASQLGNFPPLTSTALPIQHISKINQDTKSIPQMDVALAWYCHQGVLVLLGANQTKTCLCPPNYFGAQCQWQSQRISLTLQLTMPGIISTTVFSQLIIMLIDEQGTITQNHEQIAYMPARECSTKFNIYLLYPHRPKRSTTNYSIRIDLFDKTTLNYRASWYFPIPFQFLPVNRLAAQLSIPEARENEIFPSPCGSHGRYVRYTNRKSLFFCQCDQGYSGTFCNITYTCDCAKDSFCLAPSICVCPLHKFGSRCYLKHSICQSINNPCQHNGLCIPMDDRIDFQAFTCFCTEGYSGERCQYKSNQIDIRIDKTMAITSYLFLHYITVFDELTKHERTTIIKKFPFAQDTITIYVSQTFNILFVELPNQDYYLTILRETFKPLEHIHTEVLPKQRCLPIRELLNNTFLHYKYLHRVKYYPLLCREYSQLMCFYDEYHTCICDSNRFSNCFEFNITIKHDCQGNNLCQNGGQCFQNNETCPTMFLCLCQDCYYGTKCQFSTSGFIYSLDPILGYQIKPNVQFRRQPFIVKLSISITTIMFISGLITGSLSLATFHSKNPKEVGRDYYLLVSSIFSICVIIVLTIKVWQLVLSQMSLITNRSLLFVNCMLIEVILKVLLASSEWLNAGVTIERMMSVSRYVSFDKKKSKKLAKWVIFSVLLLTTLTHIHDPLHRQLVDDLDGDEQRTWCFARYSPSITIYNSFITLFHFLAPFSINLISAILIIISIARNRSHIECKIPFKQQLKQQIQQHRHILITPCMLILLGLPRLTITFITRCMRSSREPWSYLIGYFVSFIPTILTFFVFVLPSKTYKNEFDKMIHRNMRRLCRIFRSAFHHESLTVSG